MEAENYYKQSSLDKVNLQFNEKLKQTIMILKYLFEANWVCV